MGLNVTRKIIKDHLIEGDMEPGQEIGLKIDQTLTQDATGTLVMLELEAMGIDRVKTETSVQYVDHNLIQADHKNPDDHLFLKSASQRYGVWYSQPGNGVSHPVHMQRFGVPGKTLIGSDSHTPAAGSLGMLAMGAGGVDVAMAMVGEPYFIKMPQVWGVRLVGSLPDWVSAKDVILEMLRRHDVDGGLGYIFEYFGPGLESLEPMDRHVIANMGTELGATSTVFPSDQKVLEFLRGQQRDRDWVELLADEGAQYDRVEEIDLSELVPLIALPSSPGNVVPVEEVAGKEIYQSYIGSSANPGYRDFAIVAEMVKGRNIAEGVSLDINPTSRQLLEELVNEGVMTHLIRTGARVHQAGCNGCIGMGQAPATGRISLRTVPRNFPGRSGTKEDAVHLCSPETATASALTGVITDPRTLNFDYPQVKLPKQRGVNTEMLLAPKPADEAAGIELIKGPNIISLPDLDPIPDSMTLPILLKMGDDISTDEIMPAGSRILPFRSNIPRISDFTFEIVDETYVERANKVKKSGGHAVIGGLNYGQGSSREHAALAPRYLGLRVVIAKGFARIHHQNLINFGVLPLTFADPQDFDSLQLKDRLLLEGVRQAIESGESVLTVQTEDSQKRLKTNFDLSARERNILLAGGVTNWIRQRT
jgi:aconitate hydratase